MSNPVPIGGEPVVTDGEIAVRRPGDGVLVARVPRCGPAEVDRACAAAAAAAARGAPPPHERAEVLETASAALLADRDWYAERICAEAGKPIRTARAEVARCADTLRFAAVEARRLTGEMVPMDASASGVGKLAFTVREPIGVLAAITPFNFPLNLVAHKLAPAVAAGCPVVCKPAPQAPLSAIALVELLTDAGLPADWISVVTDDGREAAEPLVVHDAPAMISFTGSAEVGWAIAARAPRKKVALELGSTAPAIVCADADVGHVAGKIAAGAFGYAGQSCIAVQRVLVDRRVHAELRDALAERAGGLVVGDPAEEATDVGPLIDEAAAQRVTALVDAARSDGATVVTGGDRNGAYVTPAVVDDPPADSRVVTEEAFGPVVTVEPCDGLDDAVARANAARLRLQAGVFTRDLSRATAAASALRYGGVLVGEVPTFRADQQPYGGHGEAGNTREGPRYAVAEMTFDKFVSLPWRD